MNNFTTQEKPTNLAVTGIASFAKVPLCLDIKKCDADIAIIGAPIDIAIQGRPGARLGPRGIRIGSTRFSFKSGGSYDPERDDMYLDTDKWKIVDCGDVDFVPGDLETTNKNLTEAVKTLVGQNVMPVVLGGDHSITYPSVLGMEKMGPIDIIQFDAHLDYTKSVGGQTKSNGSPMRNSAALPYVGKIIHIGIRGIGSSGPSDYADARANGDLIYSPKKTREVGIANILSNLKKGSNVYVTIDIDGLDAAIAPATGSPMFGGFNYDEMVEMFEAIAKYSNVVGMDLVEVAPMYDEIGSNTCYLAARLIADLLGFVTKEKEKK